MLTTAQILLLLLSVIGFFLSIAATALLRMARDINEIKVTVTRVDTKHDGLKSELKDLRKI